jgi:GNAT superfamily N-acetyltransferase
VEPYPAEIPRRQGLEVATLSELAGAEEPLFELWGEAGAFPPGATGGVPTFDEWRRFILGNPLLDPEGSFTLLRAGRPVALSWLLVDRERLKAEHEWTATLPELRGQGLARLAKLHAIRWAAEHGFRELLTDNDSDNIAMLELNRSLGFRELWRRRYFRRSI